MINSVLFLLTSLGLLVRTSLKMKLRYIETLQQKIAELEKLTGAKSGQVDPKSQPQKQSIF